MKKKVAIVQSFYIPWKGYFDLMNMVDEFILYDDIQYIKRFWTSRNRIKTAQGVIWLTIPVQVKGKFHQVIKETRISDPAWNQNHWETIKRSYAKAAHFKEYEELFEDLYLGCEEAFLSRINFRFLSAICDLLGITTTLSWSMDYRLIQGKTEKLVDLCRQARADVYLSGPSARDYIQPELFREAGIELRYMDYSGYPEYEQLHTPFVHEVSIIDLIFNAGPEAPGFMKSFQQILPDN